MNLLHLIFILFYFQNVNSCHLEVGVKKDLPVIKLLENFDLDLKNLKVDFYLPLSLFFFVLPQSINRSINPSNHLPINSSINQSMNPSIHQSNNRLQLPSAIHMTVHERPNTLLTLAMSLHATRLK